VQPHERVVLPTRGCGVGGGVERQYSVWVWCDGCAHPRHRARWSTAQTQPHSPAASHSNHSPPGTFAMPVDSPAPPSSGLAAAPTRLGSSPSCVRVGWLIDGASGCVLFVCVLRCATAAAAVTAGPAACSNTSVPTTTTTSRRHPHLVTKGAPL
jgi:hypothetical protein